MVQLKNQYCLLMRLIERRITFTILVSLNRNKQTSMFNGGEKTRKKTTTRDAHQTNSIEVCVGTVENVFKRQLRAICAWHIQYTDIIQDHYRYVTRLTTIFESFRVLDKRNSNNDNDNDYSNNNLNNNNNS